VETRGAEGGTSAAEHVGASLEAPSPSATAPVETGQAGLGPGPQGAAVPRSMFERLGLIEGVVAGGDVATVARSHATADARLLEARDGLLGGLAGAPQQLVGVGGLFGRPARPTGALAEGWCLRSPWRGPLLQQPLTSVVEGQAVASDCR
jgi:hypothetical protein